jgi:hypothetical protein
MGHESGLSYFPSSRFCGERVPSEARRVRGSDEEWPLTRLAALLLATLSPFHGEREERTYPFSMIFTIAG